MFTNEHDVFDFVEQRNRELRREAADYRLSQAYRLTLVPGPSLLDRVHAQLARLHLVRPIAGQAKATA
jgi:hypothetical protein